MAQIDVKTPRLTKQGFVLRRVTTKAVAGRQAYPTNMPPFPQSRPRADFHPLGVSRTCSPPSQVPLPPQGTHRNSEAVPTYLPSWLGVLLVTAIEKLRNQSQINNQNNFGKNLVKGPYKSHQSPIQPRANNDFKLEMKKYN